MTGNHRSQRRHLAFAAIAVLLGFAVLLLLAEVVLRFLPVAETLGVRPVNAAMPVFRFAPNRDSVWSRDWNLSLVNRVHTNNAGYVNDQDYDAADPRPLFAVVGDSYVEAVMVPYRHTLHGRIAKAAAPGGRVYSFAASGAPLSQYVIWAHEARARWRAQALAVVVVGNDFDESLAAYKRGPGFHHYVEQPDGSLALQRIDYVPGLLRLVAERSALVRYLVLNMQALEHLKQWRQRLAALTGAAPAPAAVGNTSALADKARMQASERAVRAFLRDIVAVAGWAPDRVVFVVDGLRYPTRRASAAGSYFVHMRNDFIAEARRRGFEVIDMDAHFFGHFQAHQSRFEYPTDGHWNEGAHGIAARAVMDSGVFKAWRGSSAAPVR